MKGYKGLQGCIAMSIEKICKNCKHWDSGEC